MAKIGINIADPEQAVGTMFRRSASDFSDCTCYLFLALKFLFLMSQPQLLVNASKWKSLKTIRRVQKLGNIAIILITHNEIHARLIADRFTFLSLGEVIGSGTSEDLKGDDIKRLMAGGAEIGDLAKELAV